MATSPYAGEPAAGAAAGTSAVGAVGVFPVLGMPEVGSGDDLAALIESVCAATGLALAPGDVVVVSSKVVSKAMGLWADSRDEAITASTVRVVAERATVDGVTRVVESVAGPVMAAGGVDASNTGDTDRVLLLPDDPDGAAADLLEGLLRVTGMAAGSLGVVVTDTAGRPWRGGQTDFALGAAGLLVLDDLRGSVDADGRPLAVTSRAVADEIAAAADLVKGKASAVPVAIVRGLGALLAAGGDGAGSLVRTGPSDWFRLGPLEAVRAALGVEPGSPESGAVGLRPVYPETLADRVARAVRLAQAGSVTTDAAALVAVEVAGPGITLQSADEFALGAIATRLVASGWTEDLAVLVEERSPDDLATGMVRLLVSDLAPPPAD